MVKLFILVNVEKQKQMQYLHQKNIMIIKKLLQEQLMLKFINVQFVMILIQRLLQMKNMNMNMQNLKTIKLNQHVQQKERHLNNVQYVEI